MCEWMCVFKKRVVKSHKRPSELPCLQDNWDAFRATPQYRYSLCTDMGLNIALTRGGTGNVLTIYSDYSHL